MRRLLFLCLGVLLILPMAAQAEQHKILMLLWRGETEAERGFRDGIDAADKNVEFTVFNAEQDRKKLAEYLRQNRQELSQYSLIYTFGTTAALMTRQSIDDDVPHVFNIVSDPIRSGLVESYKNRGWNRAGLAISSTIVQLVDLVAMLGSLENVGFVFNPREDNSKGDWYIAKKEIIARGGEAFYMRLKADEDVAEQVAASFGDKDDVSAVILPSDSLIASKAEELMAAFNSRGIPVFTGNAKMIKSGAVAGITSDYWERGQSAAALALDILANGSAREVDSVPMKPFITMNRNVASSFNISLPNGLAYEVKYLP